MMTEHREPSIRSSRSTSTAKPPGSASSATRSSTSPCCAPDGKLQKRRLDVRFYTNLTPALTGHSIVLQTRSMPAPTLAPWNTVSVRRALNHVEECSHQSDAGSRSHWPTNPGTDGALAIRRYSPASR